MFYLFFWIVLDGARLPRAHSDDSLDKSSMKRIPDGTLLISDGVLGDALVQEERDAQEKLAHVKRSSMKAMEGTEIIISNHSSRRGSKILENTDAAANAESSSHLPRTASQHLMTMQQALDALNNDKSTGNLEYEGYFFLGGTLLIDWLESRADPLIDDSVLDLLSDAWCKSTQSRGAKTNDRARALSNADTAGVKTNHLLGHELSLPALSLAAAAEIEGAAAGPQRLGIASMRSLKFSSPSKKATDADNPSSAKISAGGGARGNTRFNRRLMSRGETYNSFGNDGDPVTAKVLDELLKTNMSRFLSFFCNC